MLTIEGCILGAHAANCLSARVESLVNGFFDEKDSCSWHIRVKSSIDECSEKVLLTNLFFFLILKYKTMG